MEGKAWGLMGLHMGGIGSFSRWETGSTGMATPGVLLAQSFKSITCFGRAFHMKGMLAVMADEVFFGFSFRFGACWAFQVAMYREAGFA